MPVPTNLSDLSPTAASNYPAATDTISTTDDYLRAHASILAKISDGTNALVSPTITTATITTANATTVDTTNLEVTNVKAKDGTASATIADSTGVVNFSSIPTITSNGSVVGTTATQTLTNKTLTLPQINDTSSDHQYVFAVNELAADRTVTLPLLTGNDEFVFKDHAVTLTNKTLTAPAINGTVTTTGLTLPALTLGGAITGNSQNISGLGTLGCGAITSSGSIAGTSLNIGTGALTAGSGTFSGNVSIGGAPLSTWTGTVGKALEVGAAGCGVYTYSNTDVELMSNCYYNAGYKFGGSGYAMVLGMGTVAAGTYSFGVSTLSGTAGNSATITNYATISSTGLSVTGNYTSTNGSQTTYLGAGSALVTGAGATDSALRFDGANLLFSYGATRLMTLDASGNLLVGLTSALANGRLQVAGSIGLSGNTQIRQASNGDGSTLQVFATQFVAGTTNSDSYNYAGGGLVASVGNGDDLVLLDAGRATATNGRVRVTNTTSGDTALSVERNGAFTLFASTAGNVLVGTTSAPGNNNDGCQIGKNGIAFTSGASSTSGNVTHMEFWRGTSRAGEIYSSNSTTTVYSTSSDYRLKENVQPMTDALARISQLKPCTYTWKVDGTAGEGFIAHELQEVCPSAVSHHKDAVDADGNPVYQGVDASFLVATLTAAIQELKAENDALKARLDAAGL